MPTRKSSRSGNAASLTCGILSIVFCWVPFIGLILGIIGLATVGGSNPNIRTGGLVTSIIGTIFSAIYMIWWLIAIAAIAAVVAA